MWVQGSSPDSSILRTLFATRTFLHLRGNSLGQNQEGWEVNLPFEGRSWRGKCEQRTVWPLSHRHMPFGNVCLWKLRVWNLIPTEQPVPADPSQSLHGLQGSKAAWVQPTFLEKQIWESWCHHSWWPVFPCLRSPISWPSTGHWVTSSGNDRHVSQVSWAVQIAFESVCLQFWKTRLICVKTLTFRGKVEGYVNRSLYIFFPKTCFKLTNH